MKIFKLLLTMIFSLGVLHGALAFAAASPPDTIWVKNQVSEKDSVEYELIIIDPGFEMWFQQNKRPEGFYSLQYLENWNHQLVNQWNMMISRPGRPGCMPTNYVHYDYHESYGMALNHKLFYYFRYVQQRCRIFGNFPRSW
jgi:hypothetical protein